MWGCFENSKEWANISMVFPTHVGVFCTRLYARPWQAVFPTHVGVFPSAAMQSRRQSGLPHACGGVSMLERG